MQVRRSFKWWLDHCSPLYCLQFYSITALQNKVSSVAAVDWQTLSSLQLSDLAGQALTDSQSAAAAMAEEESAQTQPLRHPRRLPHLLHLNHIS